MTPGRCARGVRAAMFAAVCVLLAATGHLLMSEQEVPRWTLLCAFAGTAAVAWLLAGRERGLLAVTFAAMCVQGTLHTLFSATAPNGTGHSSATGGTGGATGMSDMTDMGGMGGAEHLAAMAGMDPATHTEHLARMAHLAPLTPASGHDMSGMAPSLGMVSAHVLAALLSGLWLAHGERSVFRLLRALPLGPGLGLLRQPRLLLRLLRAAFVTPRTPRRPRVRPVRAEDERAPRPLLLAHVVVSRGPPPVLAVS
ncbi:hypothetical protein [Streptomyces sp. NPDC090025]|uniref:hypothetical protein n=1 Tax=Streptomyces sp. NPDC090025 TaxID=3365922 RepID=UPI0038338C8A